MTHRPPDPDGPSVRPARPGDGSAAFTRNAGSFCRRHGAPTFGPGIFSHGLGGDPVAIIRMDLGPVPHDVAPPLNKHAVWP